MSAERPVIRRETVYRRIEGRELKALIFSPEGASRCPALLCLHGGAWISGDRTLPAYMAEMLAARGIVVASIDFRMAPTSRYPASSRDVNYAVRWLKMHAAEYGADPDRVGGLGFSSGGHLILLAAMRPEHPDYTADLPGELGTECDATLNCVVTCSGVLDPLARYRMALDAGYAEIVACHDAYFGDGDEACMAEANPPLILERGESVELPPLLMFQGGSDARLPPDTAARTAALYRAAGAEAEAHVYPQLGHALSEWPASAQRDVAERIVRFVSAV